MISCEEPPSDKTEELCDDGTIIYTGSEELDGCGFMVMIDSINHKPTNLPVQFEDDGLEVTLCYEVLPDTLCFLVFPPVIEITDIRLR
ncbi:MAG: hypothetical protein ACE5EE_00800 [Fidelibacterota bacterium]